MSNPLLFGLTAANILKPFAVNANGQILPGPDYLTSNGLPLLVDAAGSPLVVGYAGNQLFNYQTTYRVVWEDTGLLVGGNTHDYAAIPAHQLAIITAVWFRYSVTRATNHVRFSVFDGVNDFPFTDQLAPVGGTGYSYQTFIPVKAGAHLYVTVTVAVAGDDIFTALHGYIMGIP